MKDEIIEELWKIKESIAADTEGDTKALFKRLRAIKLKSSQKWINRTSSLKEQCS